MLNEAATFIAQYAMVVLAVLVVADRKNLHLYVDNGVEKAIRKEEQDLDSMEARILLSRMEKHRVC